MENKKVKNATSCEYNGIQFKSRLEMKTYIILNEKGFNPQYEAQTFSLWEGRKFAIPCYDLHKDRKLKRAVWGSNPYKTISIKYTPDFILSVKDSSDNERMIIIECKGMQNDVYPYKKKLFLDYLEKNHPDSIFFEVHTQKQLKSAIEIINSL